MLLPLLGIVAIAAAQQLAAITPTKGQPLNAIPQLGLGTFTLTVSKANTTDVIAGAIEMGYRHIDAAAIYTNENWVGLGIAEGLRRTGLKREDIWVTTKLWNDR
jgi:alcohol dehydrogenase (NADP+)